MKVWLIDAGGSTLDILGIVTNKELAERLLAIWRTKMGVHDDGWDVQEWDVLDEIPEMVEHWTAMASLLPDGQRAGKRPWERDTQEDAAPVYVRRDTWIKWNADMEETRPVARTALEHSVNYDKNEWFTLTAVSIVSEQDAKQKLHAMIQVAQRRLRQKRVIAFKTFKKEVEAT